MIEYRWLRRLQEAQLFAYRFDAAEFDAYGDERQPHAYVAHHEVRPIAPVEPVGDLLGLHQNAGIELRISHRLWPWWDAVIHRRWPNLRPQSRRGLSDREVEAD